MFGKIHIYWFIPLLIAGIIVLSIVFMDIQITSFRNSYFADLKNEIRKSDALTVEVFKSLLMENAPEKLQKFFRRSAENPMIIHIRAKGIGPIFETPNAPLYLQEHLKRPAIKELIRGAEGDEVTIEYNHHYQAWMVYHSLRFEVNGQNYILIMAELCNSVSRLIRISQLAMTALSVFGLLVVGGLIFYFYRLVRSPLVRLQISTRAIASGNLDYPVYVPSSGAVREIACCVRDMAEHLKSQIKELRTLENCRGEFITAISHAMKTPVTAILSAVEGIEQGALDNPEYKEECIRALKIQSRRLSVLLHDFLTLTALELQEMKTDRDFMPLSLEELLRNSAAAFQNTYPDVALNVISECDHEISGDPNLWEQALSNLLDNAVKHGGATKIDLIFSSVGGLPEILIRDNGCGIDSAQLGKIFDRFHRGGARKKSAVTGNGLGLAIVKHIVKLHGGTIFATSEPGNGTTFHIRPAKIN